jgi:hypothetical protein
VQRPVDEVRRLALVAAGLVGGCDDGVGSDDHQPVRAEVQRRLDRRVQSGAAVDVPAARLGRRVDPDRREQDRDRRRGPKV